MFGCCYQQLPQSVLNNCNITYGKTNFIWALTHAQELPHSRARRFEIARLAAVGFWPNSALRLACLS
jgi:hypothetical protein